MDYKVIMDTYTIDLPEFIEKYDSTNEQGKVALNIDKFFKAINNKDYRYAYNHLSSGFKDEYFNNLSDFENYINEKFFDNNIIEYKTFEERADNIYVYKIQISTDGSNEKISNSIIVKLRRRNRL